MTEVAVALLAVEGMPAEKVTVAAAAVGGGYVLATFVTGKALCAGVRAGALLPLSLLLFLSELAALGSDIG
eukprot:CAMPEP_0175174842 /NCGR_PEP_ID=MMETSP0087-20121206/32869_1 /TAXON_ID=136419 /ORGANISM="Unknown Unknown, Strain D1" /LENGTH=70 /DNA_ID=CAMNT_0016466381 /DNA_START=179 /DNA_END=387 /DNA_ORIENTATION=-